jgi:hypothetical protein
MHRTMQRCWRVAMMGFMLCPGTVLGQTSDKTVKEEHLQQQIDKLQTEIEKLNLELQELRQNELSPSAPTSDTVREDLVLLNQKVDEEYQTKVESSSRYRVRLSGMFLVNFFGNRGFVDNIESPTFPINPAVGQSNGSFGGTVRQTRLGLEVVGPNLLNARTSGNVQMDFAGGFSDIPGGSTIGLPRLRTGTVRLDWKKTSLIAGQDRLFFSPLDPTSFASLEQPALAYSGNLWGWVPQIRVERRFETGKGSQLTLTNGILDPISGELPEDGNNRAFGVGEASREPALASHIGWSTSMFQRTLSLGGGAFRAGQNWPIAATGNHMTSWLLIADWDLPTSRWTSISGSFYRGNSVGSFGGGIGQSVVLVGTPGGPSASADGRLLGLDSMGGWVQLKYQPTQKLEFNNALGQDNPYASELRGVQAQSYASVSLFRDRTIFSNMIYRPRSNLLFSLELRHISTVQQDGSRESANHINMGVGILF